MRSFSCALILGVALVCGAADEASAQTVHVNGVRLTADVLDAVERHYGTRIASGRYWYDPRSGLWGREGGPTAGRIDAGLDFGAPLDENASDGDTPVLVNGRRLPIVELLMLQRIVGPVLPGRYWLDAYGNAGFEGGPPLVNVIAASRQAGGGGGWNRNTPGGNWGGDGNCSYYSHPDGPSVMIGGC